MRIPLSKKFKQEIIKRNRKLFDCTTKRKEESEN